MFVPMIAGLLAAAIGTAVAWRGSSGPWHKRWLEALVVLSLALATASAMKWGQLQSNHVWSSVRAAMPVAMTRGIPPYFPPGQGPLWASIYPPLGYVLYLPIALGRTPQQVIYIGQWLGLAFLYLPLCWAMWRSSAGIEVNPGNARRWAGILAGVAISLAASTTLPALFNATFTIHVDPPAVGLALAACVLVWKSGDNPPGLGALIFSAGLVAGSVYCKQTMLPVAAAISVWLAVKFPFRSAITWSTAFLVFAALGAGLCLLLLSTPGLINNCFTVPAAQGWRDESASPLLFAAGEMIRSLNPLPAISVALVGVAVALQPRASGFRRSFTEPSALLLLVGLAEIPAGLAGFAKVGGHNNNFFYTGYFLMACVTVLIARWLAHSGVGEVLPWRKWLVAGTLLWAISLSLSRLEEASRLADVPDQQDQAYVAILRNPGRIYFPWHPLSHLMAENRLTHQSFGISDRVFAKQEVSDKWLLDYLPPKMEVIAWSTPPSTSDFVYQRFKAEFTQRVEVPELPGWFCLSRPIPTSGAGMEHE